MMSFRRRGQGSMSKANTRWNLIGTDVDIDENDSASNTSTSSSSSSTCSSLIVKLEGVVVIKKSHHHNNAAAFTSLHRCSLRRMIQTDLQMAIDDISTVATATVDTSSPASSTDQQQNESASQQSSSPPPSRRKFLHDEFSEDIENLLKSLQSTEFVGTIDPQYHSRYVSGDSFL